MGVLWQKVRENPVVDSPSAYSFVLPFGGLPRLWLAVSASSCCRFSSHASRISCSNSPSFLPVALAVARSWFCSLSFRMSPLMYRFLLGCAPSQSSSSVSMATPIRFWLRPSPRFPNAYFPVGSVMVASFLSSQSLRFRRSQCIGFGFLRGRGCSLFLLRCVLRCILS